MLREGQAVTFAAGISLSVDSWIWGRLPVWEWESHAMIFRADWDVLGKCLSFCFYHVVDNQLDVSCWYFLMVTSCHCYIVSILPSLAHILPYSVEVDEINKKPGKWHYYYLLEIGDCWVKNDRSCSVSACSSLAPCQMEGSGSPRFRKLHFPVGLWINSPRKHFAKLGGRWPSAISVKWVWITLKFSFLIPCVDFHTQLAIRLGSMPDCWINN